ncbi:hypothetical protein CHS0354_038641 [Potamilus streckersoni]|nr:hypothetical protein CHS0354_038641 [Potamilus streckersoni]
MNLWISQSFCLLLLRATFEMTEGIIWISKTRQVNMCKGKTAHMTWKYVQEPGEDIKQLQWLFNRTELIASISVRHGFNVELNYKGRVERSGDNGILLKNISTQDIGNYTLYPVRAWEESPNIQSVWLNVIDPAMRKECSCTKLPILTHWRSGRTLKIMAEGCKFQINSSFCCPKGPEIQYCAKNPQKFCVSILNTSNLHESAAQNTSQYKVVPQHGEVTENTVLYSKPLDHHWWNLIATLSVLLMNVLIIVLFLSSHWESDRIRICCKKGGRR